MNNKKILILIIFILNLYFVSASITTILNNQYALDSNGNQVNVFDSSTIQDIERFQLNFSISVSADTVDSWYFNYTSAGAKSCTLGNRQTDLCFNYTNSGALLWIQVNNNTQNKYFDTTGSNYAGDYINFSENSSDKSKGVTVNILIDEHYNPNVFKHYNASYDFTDVVFQSATDKRITKEQYLKINISNDEGNEFIPVNADLYKLDLRTEISAVPPDAPLEAFLCNETYTTGDPNNNINCVGVGSKFPAEFQAGGTKFRQLFNSNLISQIQRLDWLVLKADTNTVNKYYALKTIKATAPSYDIEWFVSPDSGLTWVKNTDGYETEVNFNWFSALDKTKFMYNFCANTTTGAVSCLQNNLTWTVNSSTNFQPVVSIINPQPLEQVTRPYNITFSITDSNFDLLNGTLYIINKTYTEVLTSEMNETNSSFYWNDPDFTFGDYNLTLQVCETSTADLYCVNDTHSISYVPTFRNFTVTDYGLEWIKIGWT